MLVRVAVVAPSSSCRHLSGQRPLSLCRAVDIKRVGGIFFCYNIAILIDLFKEGGYS